jgi:hypothetical protein
VLEVTTNAFISVDTSGSGYNYVFFFGGTDSEWLIRLTDSDGLYIDVPLTLEERYCAEELGQVNYDYLNLFYKSGELDA